MKSKADKELIEDALRDLVPGQCVSVIVGTNEAGQRDIHPCCVTAAEMMHGHKTHHCGCGCEASWRYLKGDERWSTIGPLQDVVLS